MICLVLLILREFAGLGYMFWELHAILVDSFEFKVLLEVLLVRFNGELRFVRGVWG